jgi:hypothetical protein
MIILTSITKFLGVMMSLMAMPVMTLYTVAWVMTP